ncbi:hypothetical protein AAGV28_08315 [Flavobacterium sp. FZUC8N2.13]|uniref:Lipoprotein n=1 Tax=Flavobacterium zubiriense TaxID=3138075 RepID=A0ABV4TB88_9FLAO
MKLTKLFLLALSISLFVSCSNDDDVSNDDPKGIYDNGFFILNEGSKEKGSVSFLSDDLVTFTKDVYGPNNSNDNPGGYLQNIFFDGENAYIIAGGSNVINVVNRYTFKLIAKIDSGLENPRYGVAKNGKAYVTNANTYAPYGKPADDAAVITGNTDDYVAIIDLKTNKYESKINLNGTGNRIVEENGKLYITEPYNSEKLLVVNIATKALETPVTIGSSANTMEVKDGILYILRGPYDSTNEIVKVKLSDKSVSRITFPQDFDTASFLDIEEDKIFYTAGKSVYVINTNATSVSTTPLLTATISATGYIYGFAVKDNRIYIADGGTFGQDSKAFIYNLTGTLEKELTVGIGPNGFYFNN